MKYEREGESIQNIKSEPLYLHILYITWIDQRFENKIIDAHQKRTKFMAISSFGIFITSLKARWDITCLKLNASSRFRCMNFDIHF